MRCPACGRPGRVELGQPRQVTSGSIAGVLERVPVVRCDSGHREPGLSTRATVAEVLRRCRDAIPHARSRLLRGDTCSACGARLLMPVRRTERVVTLDGIDDLPVMTLRFDVPMTRCPDCGVDQLPTRSQEHLDDVVDQLTTRPGAR